MMTDTKICPCVDCGMSMQVSKSTAPSKVRCDTHRKQNRANVRAKRAYLLGAVDVCTLCSSSFTPTRPGQRLCSRSCSARYVVASTKGRLFNKLCVDCGVGVQVVSSVPTNKVRCPQHKKEYLDKMKSRHRISRTNSNKVDAGEHPYENYVVKAPTWSSKHMNWMVTVLHKSNSNKRNMTLARYRLSTKLGRRVRDKEDIVFLDGDPDNCSKENLSLKLSRGTEVA